MALHWDFKEKAGTLTQILRDGTYRTSNFYEGNALMIVPYEYEENGTEYYTMDWFFTGVDHAERCLGLQKCDDGTQHNMFPENGITQLTIYREYCREWKTIADLFTRAFPQIAITILDKAPVPEGGDDHESEQDRGDRQ